MYIFLRNMRLALRPACLFLQRFLNDVYAKGAVAFLAGATSVLGFAPFNLYLVPILSLSLLFWLCMRATSLRQKVFWGWCYGLGLFSFGIYWLFISLHDIGAMPILLAALLTVLVCALLAFFPALAILFACKSRWPLLLAMPLSWAFLEWVRGHIFTGFPWLNLGYSQVPYSPLAGYFPLLGVYGVVLLVGALASALCQLFTADRRKACLLILVIVITGRLLQGVAWTHPQGQPLRVALVQGNIPQTLKWQPESIQHTLDLYLALIKQAQADLIVLPETALPVLSSQIPAVWWEQLQAKHSDILLGLVEEEQGAYFNSMMHMASGTSYRKHHLVPFGEFIPFKTLLGVVYRNWLHIPLNDLSSGTDQPHPLPIRQQNIAINICYEDVFGEEIIRQLPKATLLVNASNDAWYGKSIAAEQHLQFSQARALETGRMMLRATNTGATAVIDIDGQVIAHGAHDERLILYTQAQGYTGSTPYVRFGNKLFLCLLVLLVVLMEASQKQKIKA